MGLGENVVGTLTAKLILNAVDFVENADTVGKKIQNLKKAATLISGAATVAVKKSIDAAQEFETAFAGVKKTISFEGTEDEAVSFFEDMWKSILHLSMIMPVTAFPP